MSDISAHEQTTKSIDVGSVFLMDISLHESDSTCDLTETEPTERNTLGHDSFRYQSNNKIEPQQSVPTTSSRLDNTSNRESMHAVIASNCNIMSCNNAVMFEPPNLSSSLDRLANLINSCSGHQTSESTNQYNAGNSAIIVVDNHQPSRYKIGSFEPRSCSLSDESYVASSGTSLSASFTASCESENGDRVSTTTREDSGVLDMRDLGSHLNSYETENNVETCCKNSQFAAGLQNQQNEPISSNASANLIKSGGTQPIKSHTLNHRLQDIHNSNTCNNKNSHQIRPYKPTENTSMGHYYNQTTHSRRVVSASLPIKVPTRQMRKDLKEMKLELMREEAALELISSSPQPAHRPVGYDDMQHDMNLEDDDTFLKQEFNANHHKHYTTNERGDEHLKAEEDPMKLFESIQALARSLHGDAELFGSLPPKRVLESPIRSIALV